MDARRLALVAAACAAALLPACGPKRVRTPDRAERAVIVLLPDPETGVVGRVAVSNPKGTADLAGARESTRVTSGLAPAPTTVMTAAEVEKIFGDALSALPSAPQRFVLFFQFESDELTPASLALVPEILQAVKNRPVPDVSVVGHTDTTGTRAGNFELGLKRANTIRDRLIAAGLSASSIEAASHGEADLLVATADDVFEPRNRRVEITVR